MPSIGIYGGSFNPIHDGHTSVAEAICQTGVVDELWFMVSPLNPLKTDGQTEILPTEERLRLASLAVAGHPCLRVSDFECGLPLPSYTFNTLVALSKTYPDCNFVLIVGQDNWQRFDKWYRSDEIKAAHDIIVYGRDGTSSQEAEDHLDAEVVIHKKDGTYVRLSDQYSFPLFNISSTQIREAFRSRDLPFAARWLHPAVFRRILEEKLYF